MGKVKDVQHWLLECKRRKDERANLLMKLFMILDQGCKHLPILKIISQRCGLHISIDFRL